MQNKVCVRLHQTEPVGLLHRAGRPHVVHPNWDELLAGAVDFFLKHLSLPPLPYVHVKLCVRHSAQIRALWVLFSVALLGFITLPTGAVTANWIIGERRQHQSAFF